MSLIGELLGKSPFGPLLEHTRKVHECVKLIKPLAKAAVDEQFDELHRLQDVVSKLEHEADQVKHEIREQLPRKYFLPVAREELDGFLRCQDGIADSVEDFAVVLILRNTKFHPELKADFLEFADQILQVGDTLMAAAEEIQNLAETSFGGAEAESVLQRVAGLGQEEWKADRMQRKLCQKIYSLEEELDPVTINFYEKMLMALSEVANSAENTGDLLREMIIRG